MSYQFIHIETYSRKSSSFSRKGKNGKTKDVYTRSIKEIVDEANRIAGNCAHVENPQPPKLLHGCDVSKVPEICEDYAKETKDPKGRKLRSDALVVIAGVVSVGDDDREQWPKIRDDSVKYLIDKYGDRLKSVVEHTDEAYPHIHFYVVPHPGERLEDIHEGLKARNELDRAGNELKVRNDAYKKAMKTFQNDFFSAVGLKNGLTRIGPGAERLSRKNWHKRKEIHKQLPKIEKLVKDFMETDYSDVVNKEMAKNGGVLGPKTINGMLKNIHTVKSWILNIADHEKFYTPMMKLKSDLEEKEKELQEIAKKLADREKKVSEDEKIVKQSLKLQNDLIEEKKAHAETKKQLSFYQNKEKLELEEREKNTYRPNNSSNFSKKLKK